MRARGHTAVMASRHEPPDSLEFFPTPPWATRALFEHVIGRGFHGSSVWEPAAGEGHMAEVLREYFRSVWASDVHDYGRGYRVGTFVGEGPDAAYHPGLPDWVITNPPFSLARDFVIKALGEVQDGVAILIRTAWLEGVERFETLFQYRPPAIVAQFVERVPMQKGKWDPDGGTATAYAWIVWRIGYHMPPRFVWIPPGCRAGLTRPDDRARFAAWSIEDRGPELFDEVGE